LYAAAAKSELGLSIKRISFTMFFVIIVRGVGSV
jgi:hypothetical protein